MVDGINASALRNAGIGGGTADRNDRLASTISMLERSTARATARAEARSEATAKRSTPGPGTARAEARSEAKQEILEDIKSNSSEPISNEEAVSRADRLKRAGATPDQSMAIPEFPRPHSS
jgi:hypothetical protein